MLVKRIVTVILHCRTCSNVVNSVLQSLRREELDISLTHISTFCLGFMAAKKTEGFTANVEGFTANVSANVPVEVQPQQGGAPMEEVAAVSEG